MHATAGRVVNVKCKEKVRRYLLENFRLGFTLKDYMYREVDQSGAAIPGNHPSVPAR